MLDPTCGVAGAALAKLLCEVYEGAIADRGVLEAHHCDVDRQLMEVLQVGIGKGVPTESKIHFEFLFSESQPTDFRSEIVKLSKGLIRIGGCLVGLGLVLPSQSRVAEDEDDGPKDLEGALHQEMSSLMTLAFLSTKGMGR